MVENKFAEGYVKSCNCYVSSEDLISMKMGKKKMIYDIKNDIFCPECCQTLLSVHAGPKKQYLSKSTKNGVIDHEEDCSYRVEVAGKKVIESFEENRSYEEIEDNLLALLDKNIAIRTRDKNAPKKIKKAHNNLVYSYSKANNHYKKRIPSQLLDDSFPLNYEPEIKKFYYVRIIAKSPVENGDWINYRIRTENNVFLFSLGIKKDTPHFSKLQAKLDLCVGKLTDFALYALVRENEKWDDKEKVIKKYRNVAVFNPHYLVVRESI